MIGSEEMTKEERLAILSVASRTWSDNGGEPFEVFLGKMTQYVKEGLYIKVYNLEQNIEEDDNIRTETDEG